MIKLVLPIINVTLIDVLLPWKERNSHKDMVNVQNKTWLALKGLEIQTAGMHKPTNRPASIMNLRWPVWSMKKRLKPRDHNLKIVHLRQGLNTSTIFTIFHSATDFKKIAIFRNSRNFRKIRRSRWALQQISVGKYNNTTWISLVLSTCCLKWQGINKNCEFCENRGPTNFRMRIFHKLRRRVQSWTYL